MRGISVWNPMTNTNRIRECNFERRRKINWAVIRYFNKEFPMRLRHNQKVNLKLDFSWKYRQCNASHSDRWNWYRMHQQHHSHQFHIFIQLRILLRHRQSYLSGEHVSLPHRTISSQSSSFCVFFFFTRYHIILGSMFTCMPEVTIAHVSAREQRPKNKQKTVHIDKRSPQNNRCVFSWKILPVEFYLKCLQQ